MRAVVTFFLFSSLSFATLPEAQFLGEPFERLDVGALRQKLRELEIQSNSDAYLATHLIEFYLREAALLGGNPHEAGDRLSELIETCLAWESSSFSAFQAENLARAAYLCVLIGAENMAGEGWRRIYLHDNLLKVWELARSVPLPQVEKEYLEARVTAALPPGWGQDLKRSLVLLTFAVPRAPKSRLILFHLARTHEWNGNLPAAKARDTEFRTKFPDDNRLKLQAKAVGVGRPPEIISVDGYAFGIDPGLFVNPVDGFGLAVRATDERIFDRDRGGSLLVAGTTRGSLRAALNYFEGEAWEGTQLLADIGARREHLDYFPLGINSAQSARTRNLSYLLRGSVGAKLELGARVYFSVGWQGETSRIEETPLAVDTVFGARSFSYSGPWAELVFDTRDSRRDPWSGWEVKVRGLFPAAGLGSPETFERWDFVARYYWILSRVHQLHFEQNLSSTSARAPLMAYPFIGGGSRLPGVQANRYRDRHSLGLKAEYQLHSRGTIRGAVYGVMGNVSPALGELLSGPGFGGGVALLMQEARFRAAPLRIELGRFKNDWVFQANVGWSW